MQEMMVPLPDGHTYLAQTVLNLFPNRYSIFKDNLITNLKTLHLKSSVLDIQRINYMANWQLHDMIHARYTLQDPWGQPNLLDSADSSMYAPARPYIWPCRLRVLDTVFPHIIAAATILFWKLECGNYYYSKEETIVL